MKKIALCLSGQLRTFAQVFASQKKFILDPFQPDVFIHTWSDSNEEMLQMPAKWPTLGFCGMLRKRFPWTRDRTKRIPRDVPDTEIKRVESLYAPVSIQVEKLADTSKKWQAAEPANLLAMYTSLNRSIQLKAEHEKRGGFKYDLVIRSRFDLLFKEPLDAVVPSGSSTLSIPNPQWDFGGVNDQFAIGASWMIDWYGQLIEHIERYSKMEKIAFHPETLLKHHLGKRDIPLSRPQLNYSIFRYDQA